MLSLTCSDIGALVYLICLLLETFKETRSETISRKSQTSTKRPNISIASVLNEQKTFGEHVGSNDILSTTEVHYCKVTMTCKGCACNI